MSRILAETQGCDAGGTKRARQTESSFSIGILVLDDSAAQNSILQSMIEILAVDDVHLPPSKDAAQLVFEIDDLPPWRPGRGVFDQDVHVAVRPEVIAENPTKQGQSANVVAPADFRQPVAVDCEIGCHHDHSCRSRTGRRRNYRVDRNCHATPSWIAKSRHPV
jgi:hypothetical protein